MTFVGISCFTKYSMGEGVGGWGRRTRRGGRSIACTLVAWGRDDGIALANWEGIPLVTRCVRHDRGGRAVPP